MIEIINLRYNKTENPYDIRVDRESVLGNPFYMKTELDRDKVCNMYHNYFAHMLSQNDKPFVNELQRLKEIHEEYNKLNLFCWCAPIRCHAETIKNWLEKN